MTITRTLIADYLDSQFSGLASIVGQDDDPEEGFRVDIDLTLRKLGVARDDLFTASLEDSQEDAAYALAEYYAARRFWRQLSDRANVKVDDSQFDYKQVLTNIQQVMNDAAAACAGLGLDVATAAWSSGYLNLDWLEPAPV